MQAALRFASFRLLLAVVLFLALYFLLHLFTALDNAALRVFVTGGVAVGIGDCGTRRAVSGAGGAGGAATWNVFVAVVGWICPP